MSNEYYKSLKENTFSFRASLALAIASSIIYDRDDTSRKGKFKALGFTEYKYIEDKGTDTQLAVVSFDDVVVVSFRGTEGFTRLKDWMQNMKTLREPNPLGGWSHFGFGEALKSVWKTQLLPCLTSLNAKEKKVYFTGHSLGGALALLAATYWYVHLGSSRKPAGIYTYGQPLVGDGTFASTINKILGGVYHRFVNDRDIVAQIPPAPLFTHCGRLYKFDDCGQLIKVMLESAVTGQEAMSEVDFAIFQQALKEESLAEEAAIKAGIALHGTDFIPEGVVTDFLFGWLIEGVKDHDRDLYIKHIGRVIAEEGLESSAAGVVMETLQNDSTPFSNFVPVGDLLGNLANPVGIVLESAANSTEPPVTRQEILEWAKLESELSTGEAKLPVYPAEFILEDTGSGLDFASLKDGYVKMYGSLEVREEHKSTIKWYVKKINAGQAEYEKVVDGTGVPWQFVAIIHALECSFNFNQHLHNGDPLVERTVRVPKGRPKAGNPPFKWEVSAKDALDMKGYLAETDWSVAHMLHRFEAYNGFGCRAKKKPSPYLWSFSNHYEKGKYTTDHGYDPEAVSKQCGAAVLLKSLKYIEA